MNKKTIIITSITIAVIILICIITFLIISSGKNEVNSNKIIKINEKLLKNEYTITQKTDEKEITIVRKDNKAYKEEKKDNMIEKSYTKDGNTYTLSEDSKKVYEYPDDNGMLYEFTGELEDLENMKFETGKEKINGKEYKYQEYNDYDFFLINLDFLDNEEDEEDVKEVEAKTRLYFSGKNLKYIKTIIGDKEELIEINISYKANESVLEWPSDYEIVEVEY